MPVIDPASAGGEFSEWRLTSSAICLYVFEANSMSGIKRGLVFSLEMSNEIVGERVSKTVCMTADRAEFVF